jgi:ATPase family associated with various cellular activities (AAA)
MSRSGMVFRFFDDMESSPLPSSPLPSSSLSEPVIPNREDPVVEEEPPSSAVDFSVYGQPDSIEEFSIYNKEIEEAQRWMIDFQKSLVEKRTLGSSLRSSKVPRILLIMGKKGCGKTLLAKLLFKKFNYDLFDVKSTLEILNTSHKSITNKQLVEQFHNVISYKNINEYKSEATSYGLLFDDVECMIETGDTSIFNEMVSLVKSAMKPESASAASGKEKEEKPKGKGKKAAAPKPNVLEMMEAAAAASSPFPPKKNTSKEVRLYNPIICTCNYTTDKKMTELKKLCKIIDLGTPSYDAYNLLFNKLLAKNGAAIRPSTPEAEAHLRRDLFEHFEYDIRKLYEFIDNVRRLATYDGFIDQKIVDLYKLIYTKADLHCQVNEATMKILASSLNVEESTILYYMDTLSIPLMVHHNMLDYVKGMGEGTGVGVPDFKTQFDAYMGGLKSLCDYDQTQTLTYKYHSWDLLPEMAAFQAVYMPNLHMQTLGTCPDAHRKKMISGITFTNILNKISQLEVNRKMVQNAYFSTNRLMIDDDELIYVIEIFLNLLQIDHRRGSDDDIDPDQEDGGGAEPVPSPKEKSASSKKKGQSPVVSQEPYTLAKSPYKRIIEIMNHYNMDIPSLEIILKIEKLNIFENKNPKRFTAKIRDELEKFVTAQASQYAMEDGE